MEPTPYQGKGTPGKNVMAATGAAVKPNVKTTCFVELTRWESKRFTFVVGLDLHGLCAALQFRTYQCVFSDVDSQQMCAVGHSHLFQLQFVIVPVDCPIQVAATAVIWFLSLDPLIDLSAFCPLLGFRVEVMMNVLMHWDFSQYVCLPRIIAGQPCGQCFALKPWPVPVPRVLAAAAILQNNDCRPWTMFRSTVRLAFAILSLEFHV
ncbi:hypothetical protein Tco_1571412 [Tanacetum coccineum]